MKNAKNVKHITQIFFLIVTVIFKSHSVYGQTTSLTFEHVSLESGLSQSSARCMIQDQFGFLWIGTQDGLNRYDGYEFKVFKYDAVDSNSLTGNFISSLFEDHEGLLWIGTVGGLTSYDPVKNIFTRYFPDPQNSSALQGKAITGLCEDAEGNIWIATYLGGLSKFNKKTKQFKTYLNDPNNPRSISSNIITDIVKDKNGDIWLGTFGSGLNRFSPTSGYFERYANDPHNTNSISSNIITSMALDDENNLLIGAHNGFTIFSPTTKTFTFYKHDPKNIYSISSDPIQKIYKDRNGNIWIGTYDAGLNYFDKTHNRFYRYQKNENDPSSLNDNSIPAIFVDRNNVLWVGTGTSGLNKSSLHPHMFTVVKNERSNPHSLSHKSIRSIFEDSKGILWIGTDNGLNRLDKSTKNIQQYLSNPANPISLSNNTIWAIAEDRTGYLWIGTQSGLNKFDPESRSFVRFLNDQKDKTSIPYNLITHIYIDDNEILWLGTGGGGLIRYDPQRNAFKQFYHQDQDSNSISDNSVYDICTGKNKQLWVSTFTGLNSFNPMTEKFVRHDQMKLSNRVQETTTIFSLHEDEMGIVWLGTLGNGLIRYDVAHRQVRNYTEKDGLSNNVVYSIVEDLKNNLWLATNKGLSRFDRINEKFKNYDVTDGLPSNEFNSGAKLRARNGKIFFGGIDGVVFFHPDSLYENTSVPNTVITQFKVFDKVLFKDKIFYGGEEIHLSYDDNYFSFEFAGLEFTEPSKNQYAYMLEGLDKDWIYSGNRRYVGYTHLEPGEFTFHVKASNNAGIWEEKGLAVKIFIAPPFWKTWWFAATMIFLFTGIVYSLLKQRINRLKKEAESQELFSKQLMEVYESERKRIASELHDGLGQNLLIIANRAKMGLKKEEIPLMQKEFEIISSSALESINDVRKITYNLHPLQIEEVGITTAIESMLKRVSSMFDNSLIFTIENVDDILPEEKRIHFYRVIQETLNNAIKHSSAKNIEVIVVKEEKTIRAIIKDNGIGFNTDIRKEGYGLRSINERIKILGGQFTIESSPGRGTLMKLIIPTEN